MAEPNTSTSPTAPDWHVVFYDSSDDDNSHEADVSILSVAASSLSSADQGVGWMEQLGGALRRGTRSLVKTAERYTRRREGEEESTIDSSSTGTELSLAYGAAPFRDHAEGMNAEERGDTMYENVEEAGVDLVETILQYQRTPGDFYLNIILAALKSGVPVDGRLLSAAVGNPILMQSMMESGYICEDDEELQAIVQEEIDRILSGDSYKGEYVPAIYSDYLYTLCQLKFSRVDLRQMVLLRYSGFSFIRTMIDYPHLLQDAVTLHSCQVRLFRSGYIFNVFILRLSWVPTLLLSPSICAMGIYWFMADYLYYGYWTILCYFVGFVAWVMTTIKAEQGKIKVYPVSTNIGYPDNYYVMFPIIPVYKIILGVQSLRYDLLPSNSRFFVMRHDLSNGFSLQQIEEGTFSALPQLVLQIFFYSHSSITRPLSICFYSFIALSFLSIFCALSSYARYATYSHSCDLFGFAVLTVEELFSKGKILTIPILPSNVITRFVQFFSTAFTVSLFVTMIVVVSGMQDCPHLCVVIVVVCLLLTLLTVIIQIVIIATCRFRRLNALVALPLIIAFTLYLVYTAVVVTEPGRCVALKDSFLPPSHYPAVVLYGSTFILLLIWLAMVFVEAVTRKRIMQRSIDYCFWQTCKVKAKQNEPTYGINDASFLSD